MRRGFGRRCLGELRVDVEDSGKGVYIRHILKKLSHCVS